MILQKPDWVLVNKQIKLLEVFFWCFRGFKIKESASKETIISNATTKKKEKTREDKMQAEKLKSRGHLAGLSVEHATLNLRGLSSSILGMEPTKK